MLDVQADPELPEPNAALILLMALVQAHLKSLSKKERALFLAEVHNALGLQEASYAVLRFRPRTEDRNVYRAMRQAQCWWRNAMGTAIRLTE